MFKIELKNRDFRKSLYFYIVDAGKKKIKKIKKKRAASGCWHYIKSRANIKWTLEKYGLIYTELYIFIICILSVFCCEYQFS